MPSPAHTCSKTTPDCWRCKSSNGPGSCCSNLRPKIPVARMTVKPGVTPHDHVACKCDAGVISYERRSEVSANRSSGAPFFALSIAKTGSESFRADLPKHMAQGWRLSPAPRERCFDAIPSKYRVVTMVREPRANVQSQWAHCRDNQDGWFNPRHLPPDLLAWLQYWNTTLRESPPGPVRTFHCYLPSNLQVRYLSCHSSDPCIPFTSPALDTLVMSDDHNRYGTDVEAAVRRVADGADGLEFVGVTDRYQESLCTLHALQRGEVPPGCDCQNRTAWAQFVRANIQHRTDSRKGELKPRHPPLSAHETALIDELNAGDWQIYRAALARLHRDAKRVEQEHGVRIWCGAEPVASPGAGSGSRKSPKSVVAAVPVAPDVAAGSVASVAKQEMLGTIGERAQRLISRTAATASSEPGWMFVFLSLACVVWLCHRERQAKPRKTRQQLNKRPDHVKLLMMRSWGRST